MGPPGLCLGEARTFSQVPLIAEFGQGHAQDWELETQVPFLVLAGPG